MASTAAHVSGSRSVAVVGMHRSGTSAVARLINLLGVYLGKEADLIGALDENPEGFWERLDIMDLHDRILSALGTTWATGCPLPDQWSESALIQPFKRELSDLVETQFQGHPLWGWKDPRTCLLLSLWKDVLADLGVETVCIFVARHPLDVAQSLQRRNGFSIRKSLGIWFNYNLSALKFLQGMPSVFVSYDALLADWAPELRRCAAAVRVEWPANDGEFQQAVSHFLSSSHRHSFTESASLRHVNQLVDELYCILRERLAAPWAILDGPGESIDSMYARFHLHSAFYEDDLRTASSVERELERCKEKHAQLERPWRHRLATAVNRMRDRR